MQTIKCSGKKIAELGAAGRRYVVLTGIGRTFIPKELGLKAGDTLSGSCSVEEVTYEFEVDGVTKRAIPLKRWEMKDFTSFADQRSTALAELEIATIPTLVLDSSYFAKAFSATAAMATP